MAEKKKPRYGVWFIVILLLVGLAGFGTGGLNGTVRTLGTVGSKDVTVSEYQRTLNDQIRALSAQFNAPVSFQQAQAFGIDRAALNQVILSRTLDSEATRLGLSVGDENVLERIVEIPAFFGAGGTFNRESYRFALERANQTEAAFETEVREDMTRGLLQAAIIGGIPDGDRYADTLTGYLSEQRSITWASVDDSILTDTDFTPQEADLQAFYTENPDAFTLPETRDITYVWLTPDMIQDRMDVPDAAIAQLYEDRAAEFLQPERRLVERLVYLDSAAAGSARARLDSGEAAFEDLVAERGLSLADIDLGDVGRDDLGAAGDAVFTAETGDVVGPLAAGAGVALFRVNAVLAAQDISLEEATPDLREELAANAAREIINQDTDRVIDLLAGGLTLEALAEQTDMQLGTINWAEDTTDGIAAYADFRAAAASVAQGAFPELLDLEDGGIFALRLDGITPPALQPLDDVRDAVADGWVLQASQQAVRAAADAIAAGILPLTDFTLQGLDAQSDAGLTRRSFLPGTPQGFMETVFDMETGAVEVVDTDTGAIIVRLDAVTAPDPADPAVIAQRAQLAETAAAGVAQDVFDTYAARLREQTEININQATVNAVNAQFQ